jgi:hypothetical protein
MDYNTAYKTITDRVLSEWSTRSTQAVGKAVEMRFKGIEKKLPEAMFARFTMKPVLERQSSHRGGTDAPQRYRSSGLIFIQVFSPKSNGQIAEEQTRKLAQAAKAIFRGKTFDGCIEFRNVRIVDLEDENQYLRKNMIAEYEYDEIA